MEYKISDVAKLFDISKEMVRYYEKCGVLVPKRTDSNNYRVYTTEDMFLLGEIIHLQKFGVNIKDSNVLKSENFVEKMLENYKTCAFQLANEISYNELLLRRCEELIDEIETASLNFDSYWIKKVQERIEYPYQIAHGDNYGEIITSLDVCQCFFGSEKGVFAEPIVTFFGNSETWSFSINKKYVMSLNLPEGSKKEIPAQICCCTIVDMGEFGEFSSEKCQSLIQYVKNKDYPIVGDIYGVLRGRGMRNGKLCRLLELRVPIRKQ